MRLILTPLLLILLCSLKAQMTLSGQIKGVTQRDTVEVNIPFDAWYYKQKNLVLTTTSDGSFSTILPIEKPLSIFVVYRKKKMLVYAEPKKDVFVSFQKDHVENTIRFEGSLKRENNFRTETGLTFFESHSQIPADSITPPEAILTSIQQRQATALTKLQTMNPAASPAFQKMTQKDIAYLLATQLWEIIWNRDIFSGGKIAGSDLPWRAALQKAYQAYPVSDDAAVDSYFYQVMVAYYPRALELATPGKDAFLTLAAKVLQKPAGEAAAELQEKGRRYWEYKAIHYGFKNEALEFALASFIDNGMNSGELTNIKEAYTDFVSRFPKSRYLIHLNNLTAPYFASVSAPSSQSILFDQASSTDTSLQMILAKHRGKVVYIDLWGTWCGPCREEFSYNKELTAYFKNKPVDFIYIAFEHRDAPEKLWRETVRFYDLTGRHILAGKQLQESIINMYSSNGAMQFPRYLLVDKNGNIKTLFAERPSTKNTLYTQIDQLLN